MNKSIGSLKFVGYYTVDQVVKLLALNLCASD